MIEPTDEMVRAYCAAANARYEQHPSTPTEEMTAGLAAVLAIVERDQAQVTEYTVRLRGDLGDLGREHFFEPMPERNARIRLAYWKLRQPQVEAVLLTRQVIHAETPWVPVADQSTPLTP